MCVERSICKKCCFPSPFYHHVCYAGSHGLKLFFKSINTLTQVLLLSQVLWGVSTVLKEGAFPLEWVAPLWQESGCLLQEVWSSHKDHQMQKSMLERPQTSQMQAELVCRCSTYERSTQTQRHLHAWSKGSHVFHTCPDAHWTVYLPTFIYIIYREKLAKGRSKYTMHWTFGQWLFLVPLIGGRYHIIPQLAVYTTYIPLISTYSPCQLGDYMVPIPPSKGTRFHSIDLGWRKLWRFAGFFVFLHRRSRACKRWMHNRGHLRFFRLQGGRNTMFFINGVICIYIYTWNAKCPIFLGNFTLKPATIALKIGHLAFQVTPIKMALQINACTWGVS